MFLYLAGSLAQVFPLRQCLSHVVALLSYTEEGLVVPHYDIIVAQICLSGFDM